MADVPETATLKEFGSIAGYVASYCTQLKAAGRLVMADDGKRVRVRESLARIAATRDPAKAGVAARHAEARGDAHGRGRDADDRDEADDGPQAGYDFQGSKAKREHYAAEREHMAFRKEAGELMEAAAVNAAFAGVGAMVRSKLEAWPSTVSPTLVGRDESGIRSALMDEVQGLLRDMVDAIGRMRVSGSDEGGA